MKLEEAYTILLNTKGDKSELCEELSELLSYIRNPKLEYHTELVNTIDRIIAETKGDEKTTLSFLILIFIDHLDYPSHFHICLSFLNMQKMKQP